MSIEIVVKNRLGTKENPLLAHQGGSLEVEVYEDGKKLPQLDINLGGWLFELWRMPVPGVFLSGKETATPSFSLPPNIERSGEVAIVCHRGSWKGKTIAGRVWGGWIEASSVVLHVAMNEQGIDRVVDNSTWRMKDIVRLDDLGVILRGEHFYSTRLSVVHLKEKLLVTPKPDPPPDHHPGLPLPPPEPDPEPDIPPDSLKDLVQAIHALIDGNFELMREISRMRTDLAQILEFIAERAPDKQESGHSLGGRR